MDEGVDHRLVSARDAVGLAGLHRIVRGRRQQGRMSWLVFI